MKKCPLSSLSPALGGNQLHGTTMVILHCAAVQNTTSCSSKLKTASSHWFQKYTGRTAKSN
jgi:hypothetical protein